jgi:hypothetical protein
MQKIRTKKDGEVYRQDWGKVEQLPFGGPYADQQAGFNDHKDTETGEIYRVRFATWTEAQSVTKQNF